MRRRLFVILLLVLLLCVACNSKLVSPTVSPLSLLTSLPTASSAPATLASSPTPLSTIAPTSLPTATPAPAGSATPVGLFYKTQDGLWRIEVDGKPTKLLDQVDGIAISPDGDRLLAVENDPEPLILWLIDLKTGQRRHLTENLDRVVCCPVWWPSRPNWVLFQSWAPGDEAPDAGYLTAARVDREEQRVLDSQNRSNGLPASAPNGRAIAYDRHGEAWLYDWGGDPRQFDPEVYDQKNIQRIASPAWSPDGKQLAWYIGGDFGQGWQVGLAVFDLKAETGRLLHVYTNVGRSGWFDAPVWSPDGQWLAFSAEDQDQAKAGLWVTRVDGQEERLITSEGNRGYVSPVWSPDGRWLIAGRALYEAGIWQAQPLALPSDAEVVAWINPTPQ
jgi:Tol biopolymer transport system component